MSVAEAQELLGNDPANAARLKWNYDQELVSRAGILWRSARLTIGTIPAPPIQRLLDANVATSIELMQTVENDWANRADYGYTVDLRNKIRNATIDGLVYLHVDRTEYRQWMYDLYLALNLVYPTSNLDDRPLAKVIVPAYLLTRDLEAGQPKIPGADDYPGTVPASAPRVTRSLTYDFNRSDAFFQLPKMISTGLYAPAGEIITITVAEGTPYYAIGGEPELYVQVGIYNYTTISKPYLARPPVISFRQELLIGENVITSPTGDLIHFISHKNGYRDSKVELTIAGGVEAPYFILGRDTNADYINTIRDKPASWAEIQSNYMIQTIRSDAI